MTTVLTKAMIESVFAAHLEAVTIGENVKRGEGPSVQYGRRTHCGRGHELSGDNVQYHHGYRVCRTCRCEDYQRDRLKILEKLRIRNARRRVEAQVSGADR